MKFCLYNVTTTIKIGGIETFFWEVAKELAGRGNEVELIAGNGSMVKYPELKIKQFDFIPRERIIDLGNRFRKWAERISFFKNAYFYLKKQRYDVFLLHKPLDFFAAWFVKRNNPGVITVFVSGGEDFYGFDRFFSRAIDIMISVSRSNAAIIESRYGRKAAVIPNGVDVQSFEPDLAKREEIRKKFNLENKKTLISVGRVVGWKGFQLVIKALAQMPEWHYLLIGDGEYLQELKKLADENGVAKRVIFAGSIDNKLLSDYLNAGDVFIQPSIGHEAFGITLIEAMACNLPVAASRNGGMVDIVRDGVNGNLFETGDIEDMILTVEKTFLQKDEMNPRAYVTEHFTWSASVDKISEKIRKFVDKNNIKERKKS